MKSTLLVSTRKGLITYKLSNGAWKYHKTEFLGIPVNLTYVDPNTGHWWACLDHGHWGCKLHRSEDEGKNWTEVDAPKYPEGYEIKEGMPASVKYLWAFSNAGVDRPGEIWIGTEPGGLFFSKDNGEHFELNEPLWNHPSRKDHWFGGGRDHAGIHSIIIDPDNSNHITLGVSVAGVFETLDGGNEWHPLNKGLKADFLPDPDAEYGHDPHLLVAAPSDHNVLWQQNHCGIFYSKTSGKQWEMKSRKGNTAHFGFAIVVDEQDPDTAWVAPAISDETRVAIDNSLCICRTEDGGDSWMELRNGLPQEACFDIVFRHAMSITENSIAFGTTTGNLFLSHNRGDSWECLNHYLPMVYSVEFV